MQNHYDVVILGGGLAGLCLSRLLGLEAPELRVLTLDTGSGPSRGVGESTVEIGAHFLHSRLQLADVLARTQLPKNGLRYWFDDEARSLSFAEASEDGPATFSYWRSYQLERESFERGLLELELERGLATHLYDVTELELDGQDEAEHAVAFTHAGERRRVGAAWLVDATAVGCVPSPRPPARDPRLTHSARWTWFEGAGRIDELVPARAGRPCFGARQLSTNHVLGEGYWIWLIPLASGLLSVGLVYDHTVLEDAPEDQEQLLSFLRSHRMLKDLLADARPHGFGRVNDYSRRPGDVLGTDRRAWVGMAAGFADPFYSNGIDMLAIEVEALARAIRAERGGQPLTAELTASYNRCVELFYEQVVVFVSGIYPSFASHELSVIRYRRDIHVYWTLYTWAYMSGRLLDPEFLRDFLPCVERSLESSRFFARLLRHTQRRLSERGQLRRDNQGRYTFNQLGFRNFPYVRCEQQMGGVPELAACERSLAEIDAGGFLALLDCLFDGDRSPLRRLLFDAVVGQQERLRALEAEAGELDDDFWAGVFELLSSGLQAALTRAGVACEGIQLDAASYGRLLPYLLERCAGPEAEAQLRQLYFEVPQLQTFEAPQGSAREHVQRPRRWSVDHTPWMDVEPSFQTVYELLGPAWLRGEGGLRFPAPAAR